MEKIKKLTVDYLELEVGKPHPRYPTLIVREISPDGSVKYKGQRGWRHPKHPFLMALTKRDRKIVEEIIEDMKKNPPPIN